jgi:hypothetical protein
MASCERWRGQAAAPSLSGGHEAPPPPIGEHQCLLQAATHVVAVRALAREMSTPPSGGR